MRFLIVNILGFTIFSCNQPKEAKIDVSNTNLEAPVYRDSLVQKKSELRFDNSLPKWPKYKSSYLVFSGKDINDTNYVFCRCEKNVKANRIIIQLHDENFNSPKRESYIAFYMKDSILEKTEIIRRSREKLFNGKYFDQAPIEIYSLVLNKSKYNIAQNVWGFFDIELPEGFNHYPGVTFIKGGFTCDNMEVRKFNMNPELPPGKKVLINEDISFPQGTGSKGYELYHYCECEMNNDNSGLVIKNKWGDGLAGSELNISLSKTMHADFNLNTWTDYSEEDDFYHKYYFNRYKLELNKNPFSDGLPGLIGKYWIATEPLPGDFGERRIHKAFFICR